MGGKVCRIVGKVCGVQAHGMIVGITDDGNYLTS